MDQTGTYPGLQLRALVSPWEEGRKALPEYVGGLGASSQMMAPRSSGGWRSDATQGTHGSVHRSSGGGDEVSGNDALLFLRRARGSACH